MKRLAALAAAGAIALAACGSEDAAPAETIATESELTAESADTDFANTSNVDDTDSADTDGDPAEAESGAEEAFPVTIEHKFGESTIDTEPKRVVSVGFNEHDFLLALGVTPVGLREWYGDQPNGVWPWAQDELGDAEPEVIAPDAINFEQIAALEPDLIVGVWSGMTAEDYELLAAIAPTVAQPDTYEDYGTPWQEQTMILGRATGRTAEAETVVADIEAQFAAVRDEHPDWAGQEASVAFVFGGNPGAYVSQDTRSRIMADLGFAIPQVNDSGGDGSFFIEFSPEDIDELDVDLLVWTYSTDDELNVILDGLPTRPTLAVVQEGREVFADPALTGAFSHGSPLSLEFALDALVAEIEAALDGDPTTPVPSAIEVGAIDDPADDPADDPDEAEPVGDAADDSADAPDGGDEDDVVGGAFGDEDASAEASAAWALVFDSTVAFDDKAPYLADADALADTARAYTDAGAAFGGISLVPTDAVVTGDTAEVTYDVEFGENPAYSDQVGTLSKVDGVWTVGRDEFCAFMSSARVSCP